MKFTDGEMVLRRFDDITRWLKSASVQRAGATTWREFPNMRLASFDKERNQYFVDVVSDFLDRTPFPHLSVRFTDRGEGGKCLSELFKEKGGRYWNPVVEDWGRFSCIWYITNSFTPETNV